jgi:hypothetical protein
MSYFSSLELHLRPWKCPIGRSEALTHIHGIQMNFNAVNPWPAAAQRAARTQKAADVRKKRMKCASDIQGLSSPEETFMVGRMTDPMHGLPITEDECHGGDLGRDSDFG